MFFFIFFVSSTLTFFTTPLNGQCYTESIIYQVNITANISGYKEKVYLGVSETTFKVRYGNH